MKSRKVSWVKMSQLGQWSKTILRGFEVSNSLCLADNYDSLQHNSKYLSIVTDWCTQLDTCSQHPATSTSISFPLYTSNTCSLTFLTTFKKIAIPFYAIPVLSLFISQHAHSIRPWTCWESKSHDCFELETDRKIKQSNSRLWSSDECSKIQ